MSQLRGGIHKRQKFLQVGVQQRGHKADTGFFHTFDNQLRSIDLTHYLLQRNVYFSTSFSLATTPGETLKRRRTVFSSSSPFIGSRPSLDRLAGFNALQDSQTTGWKEGRYLSAFFDTSGYLATYADIAAASINPLDHYMFTGWKEGRDPSASFDTTAYLVANPDVAAANMNPLQHFLKFGIYEGRSPQSDGLWGRA